jgi:hypothetical protein
MNRFFENTLYCKYITRGFTAYIYHTVYT